MYMALKSHLGSGEMAQGLTALTETDNLGLVLIPLLASACT